MANTLVVDVGGTGIKMITADGSGVALSERARALTPSPAHPAEVMALIEQMARAQPVFDRVSVGFPGVVRQGTVHTAPNLGTEAWKGTALAAALEARLGKPVRVLNDAELQGFGVIDGDGVELVLTLGTGLGAGLYTDGYLVPNLELGHHPWQKGQTYEERVSDAALKRIGRNRWRRRVRQALETLNPIFNPETIHLGGGNAGHLLPEDIPDNCRLFDNVDGMTGGVRLWEPAADAAPGRP